MCGRFVLSTAASVLRELFRLERAADVVPRWNIAPTQDAPVIRAAADGARELANLRWGLVPWWMETVDAAGGRMINARAETAATSPAVRAAMEKRRCIVPADGFYEWQAAAGSARKRPFFVRARSKQPLALAGLWERWRGGASGKMAPGTETVESFTILTTSPNLVMKSLHDRMPVILSLEDVDGWLETGDRSLLKPCAEGLLEMWEVSTLVNSPRNEGPDLLGPADQPTQRGLWG